MELPRGHQSPAKQTEREGGSEGELVGSTNMKHVRWLVSCHLLHALSSGGFGALHSARTEDAAGPCNAGRKGTAISANGRKSIFRVVSSVSLLSHAANSPSQTSPQTRGTATMQLCSHTLGDSGACVLFPHWRVRLERLSPGKASVFLLLPIKTPSAVLSPSLPSIASDRVCQLAEVRISFLQTTCFQSVGPKVS